MAFPLVLAVSIAALLVASTDSGLVPPSALPLRTRGRHVVGAQGQRVQLACVNWYGAHLEQMVVNGLNKQPLRHIAQRAVELGFNCIRLPYNLDMIYANATHVPNVKRTMAANADLWHLSPLEVFDRTVEALTSEGLLVILNNHVSSAKWCCGLTDGQGLWFTRKYPEQMWLEHLALMARRYKDNPLVAGFDLRNEIRPSGLGSPSWGSGNEATDWAIAATKGGKRVLAENGDMLIIVSGLWFSIFLCDVPKNPIHLTVPELRGHTVYTSHEYNWVNFHLVTRSWIQVYIGALAGWCCLLWLSFAISWCMEVRGYNAKACMARYLAWIRCSCCCCCRRAPASSRQLVEPCCSRIGGRSCPQLSREATVAVVLTALSLIGFWITHGIIGRCSVMDWVMSIGFLTLALASSVISLVLWMRVALATAASFSEDASCQADGDGCPVVQEMVTSPSSRSSRACCSRREISLNRVQPEEPLSAIGPAAGSLSSSRSQPLVVDTSCDSLANAGHTAIGGGTGGGSAAGAVAAAVAPVARGASLTAEEAPPPATTRQCSPGSPGPAGPARHQLMLACSRKIRSTRGLIMAVAAVIVLSLLYVQHDFGKYEVFASELDTRWGFLIAGDGDESAPVWIGELGTDTPDIWWNHTMRYIRERGADFAYWSLNGEKSTGRSETFGILMEDSTTVRHPWKVQALQELISGSSPASSP